jgi:hypothetical protein
MNGHPCGVDVWTVDVSLEAKMAAHALLVDLMGDHPADCTLCAAVSNDPGDAQVAEITEADVTAAVAQAVADKEAELLSQISDLQARLDSQESDARVADLLRQIDAEAVARKAVEDQLADTIAFLASEQERLDGEAALALVKAERAQAVRDLELFPADQVEARIEANSDRWAAMVADEWAEQLADYQAVKARITDALTAAGSPAGKAKEPGHSALGAGGDAGEKAENLVRDVMSNRYAITGRI